jgi:hypothetical protein
MAAIHANCRSNYSQLMPELTLPKRQLLHPRTRSHDKPSEFPRPYRVRVMTRPSSDQMAAPMRRDGNAAEYACEDCAEFRPNLSPRDVLQGGAFGGTYFRDIVVNGVLYADAWREFEAPATDWFHGLDISKQVASLKYDIRVNKYRVKCGQSLEIWVDKGWIKPDFDSHGWFHWYCRFFRGRRCTDDGRQISRWKSCAGEAGRWKRNLIAKCLRAGKRFDDHSVSPVVRQTLAHWGYALTQQDFTDYAQQLRRGKATR